MPQNKKERSQPSQKRRKKLIRINWQNEDLKIFLKLLLMALIILAIFLISSYFTASEVKPEDRIVEEELTPLERGWLPRYLDGVYVEPGAENLLPIAVMIDNHVDSRLPRGLSKAQLVYEAVTEGGISRFMAIYATDQEIEKIGPVRSARPYFVEWAEEWGVAYFHCGGSNQALNKLNFSSLIFDINEFYQGQYFWRDQSLPRPYNIFTSSELIRNCQSDKELSQQGNFISWQFVDDPLELETVIEDIGFNYSPYDEYQVNWYYNQENNNYLRYQGSRPHLDEDGGQLLAKNIIFQYIATEVIDDIGRKEIDTRGQGEILIFQNGSVEEGRWKKITRQSKTKFYYSDGQEVVFNRGPTWIEVLPLGYEVVY